MLNRHARGFFTSLFTPIARWLLKMGVSPDAVTIAGTAGVIFGGLVLYPLGHLWWGSVMIAVFAFSDVVDGIMARLQERRGGWGNFLDSSLDRLADGAIFAGLGIWFFTQGGDAAIGAASVICLVLGMVVSYVRAKAESLGYHASVGIAERAERLASVLLVAGLTGLGLPPVVLFATMILLALASVVTIVQRMATVRKQAMAEANGMGSGAQA
ncbi:phosphatidylinositol phosphate synthase [Paenarthrobacter sp. NCHU4564]|uniref:phosphatidylinositol phosphate synthase n=1 Tax=Paenarthrobacter sp. NCHU4564 TaxID=3451353 RepID=UPI003F9D4C37